MASADIEAALRDTASIAAAARQLGITEATLHRWFRQGRVQRPSRARRERVATGSAPAAWGDAIREAYHLSPSELELVRLGERALAMSMDDTVKPETRLAATARFAALVRQLDLEVETDGEIEETEEGRTDRKADVRQWPRSVS